MNLWQNGYREVEGVWRSKKVRVKSLLMTLFTVSLALSLFFAPLPSLSPSSLSFLPLLRLSRLSLTLVPLRCLSPVSLTSVSLPRLSSSSSSPVSLNDLPALSLSFVSFPCSSPVSLSLVLLLLACRGCVRHPQGLTATCSGRGRPWAAVATPSRF